MRYHGGKSKSGRRLSGIIQEIIDENPGIKTYCEPFCGACGIITHLVEPNKHLEFLAGDQNQSMIMLFTSLNNGFEPDIENISKERYEELKGDGTSSAEKGFLGHVMSFSGLYFCVYAESLRSRLPNAKRNIIKRGETLRRVTFSHGNYDQYSHLTNTLFMLDPPYKMINSRYYDEKNKKLSFNSEQFFGWCKMMAEPCKNNIIIINEMSNLELAMDLNPVVIELVPRNVNYTKHTNSKTESFYIIGNILGKYSETTQKASLI